MFVVVPVVESRNGEGGFGLHCYVEETWCWRHCHRLWCLGECVDGDLEVRIEMKMILQCRRRGSFSVTQVAALDEASTDVKYRVILVVLRHIDILL